MAPNTTTKKDEEIKKDETVTLTKEQYDSLLEKMETLQKQMNFVSDKARTERWQASQTTGKSLLPTAGVSKLDGKYIVGWRTIANEAEMRGNIYYENQIIEVTYKDGEAKKMNLIEFYRHKTKVSGEIIKRTKEDFEGAEKDILVIRMPDGEEITIDKTFIN